MPAQSGSYVPVTLLHIQKFLLQNPSAPHPTSGRSEIPHMLQILLSKSQSFLQSPLLSLYDLPWSWLDGFLPSCTRQPQQRTLPSVDPSWQPVPGISGDPRPEASVPSHLTQLYMQKQVHEVPLLNTSGFVPQSLHGPPSWSHTLHLPTGSDLSCPAAHPQLLLRSSSGFRSTYAWSPSVFGRCQTGFHFLLDTFSEPPPDPSPAHLQDLKVLSQSDLQSQYHPHWLHRCREYCWSSDGFVNCLSDLLHRQEYSFHPRSNLPRSFYSASVFPSYLNR